MKRSIYFILLVLPFILAGAVFKENFPTKIFPLLGGVYAPILTIIRMKYIKKSWKETFKSLFSLSLKERNRVFWDK